MTQHADQHSRDQADGRAADRLQEEIRFNEKVAQRARSLEIDRAARARVEAKESGPTPPFDAGLLGEVLQRAPEPPPRVEDLIPAEAGTLVVAAKKTGKTTFQLNLARSLIDGSDFLGRFGVRPIDGNVGVLNYEVSGFQIAKWANEHGIATDRLFLVNLRGRRNPFAHPDDSKRLADLLRLHDVETLIVDPFGRAYVGKSQNDPGEVGAWLSQLDQFARSEGAGCVDVILAAHAGWNGERTRGASALDDWADSVINLTRDKDDDQQRFMKAEGRDILIAEDQLTFHPDTRTLRLAGTGSRRNNAKIRQVEALRPHVIELLKETPTMSGNQIDKGIQRLITEDGLDLRHSKGDGARAANLLVKAGLILSKQGPRGATNFTLSSPSSPDIPQGSRRDFPNSLFIGEVAQGTQQPLLPTQGTPTTGQEAE